MLTLRYRIIIAVITAIIALSFIIEQHYIIGSIVAILVGGLLAFDFFWNGTVFAAMRTMQNGDLDATEKVLAETRYPDRLGRFQKAYYYLTRGMIDIQRNNSAAAEGMFKKALDIGVRKEEEGALYFQLANIRAMKRDLRGSRMYLDKALKAENTPQQVTEQMKLMNKELKKHGY